jgi:hypothetical protein
MPVLARRRPSLDIRKAAKAVDAEGFTIVDSDMDFPAHKLAKLPSRQKVRGELRVSTSSPILHQQYQSDEEQPSPSPDDYESGQSEYESCEPSDESDYEYDDDTPIALPDIFSAALAVAVPITPVGKPTIINITTFAPMAKRSIPISRPQSASFTTFKRVTAPRPTAIRSSTYEPLFQSTTPRNFSTPLIQREPSPLSSEVSDASEGDLLIRESDQIQVKSQSILAGTEWDMNLESSTPLNYSTYDPYAIKIPHLTKAYEEEKPKGWKRLGLKTKLLTAGRKTSRN